MRIVKSERTSARVLQWIARILGCLLCGIVFFIFGGNLFGGSDVPEVDPNGFMEILPTLIILAFWMAFFVIAWFYELVGSIGTIVCAIIMAFPIYFTSGSNKMGMFIIIPSPFLLVGILFLTAMFLEKEYQKRKTHL